MRALLNPTNMQCQTRSQTHLKHLKCPKRPSREEAKFLGSLQPDFFAVFAVFVLAMVVLNAQKTPLCSGCTLFHSRE
jgi:hypothetical protein